MYIYIYIHVYNITLSLSLSLCRCQLYIKSYQWWQSRWILKWPSPIQSQLIPGRICNGQREIHFQSARDEGMDGAWTGDIAIANQMWMITMSMLKTHPYSSNKGNQQWTYRHRLSLYVYTSSYLCVISCMM